MSWEKGPILCLLKVSRHFGGKYHSYVQGQRISQTINQRESRQQSCSTYSSLKMEAICSSEMLIDIQQTTQYCVPEDNSS
jgi:hypothetical protein